MGKRRLAREMALQMLYQSEVGAAGAREVIAAYPPGEYAAESAEEEKGAGGRATIVEQAFDYARLLVTGTLDHLEDIDLSIRSQADNWRLERMPTVDRNILRLAVYEMTYESETPALVVVDEAIELAKKFGSEQSGRFVNGLLDGLMRKGAMAEEGA